MNPRSCTHQAERQTQVINETSLCLVKQGCQGSNLNIDRPFESGRPPVHALPFRLLPGALNTGNQLKSIGPQSKGQKGGWHKNVHWNQFAITYVGAELPHRNKHPEPHRKTQRTKSENEELKRKRQKGPDLGTSCHRGATVSGLTLGDLSLSFIFLSGRPQKDKVPTNWP